MDLKLAVADISGFNEIWAYKGYSLIAMLGRSPGFRSE
jgi:hypothetical protein